MLHESTVQNKLFALVDAMANAALDPVQARSLLGLRIEAEVCMPDSVEFTAESFLRLVLMWTVSTRIILAAVHYAALINEFATGSYNTDAARGMLARLANICG